MLRPTLAPSAPDTARRRPAGASLAPPPLVVAGLIATCIAACEYSQLIFVRPAAASPLGLGDPALLAFAPHPAWPSTSTSISMLPSDGRRDAASHERGCSCPRG